MASSSRVQRSATTSRDQHADQVLASFRQIFLKDMDTIHIDSMRKARKKLEDLPAACPQDYSVPDDLFSESKLCVVKHEHLRKQLEDWLASIGELVQREVGHLARIAQKSSYRKSAQDEARWAREEVEGLVEHSFGQELAPALPLKLIIPKINKPFVLVEHWCRYVCEGGLNFSSNWTAPIWCEDWFKDSNNLGEWVKGDLPERLSRDATKNVLQSHQASLEKQLDEFLVNAEDRVRVELAGPRERATAGDVASRDLSKRREIPAPLPTYRSPLKRHIRTCLNDDPNASDLAICRKVDEQGIEGIPSPWLKGNNRELEIAYRNDKQARGKISTMISKVRRDLGISRSKRLQRA